MSSNETEYLAEEILNFFLGGAPAAYGGSQARGRIKAVAADLHHSHSNARSSASVISLQLVAKLDPQSY